MSSRERHFGQNYGTKLLATGPSRNVADGSQIRPGCRRCLLGTKAPRYLKGPRRELLRSVLMLLRYCRAIEALQSSLDRIRELPSKLIMRALAGGIPPLKAHP